MFVSDFKTSSVLRYNADTGAFFDVFVQPRSGGLDGPWGTAFGLDHNFYVASERTNSVLVYDGSTGAFGSPSSRGVLIPLMRFPPKKSASKDRTRNLA